MQGKYATVIAGKLNETNNENDIGITSISAFLFVADRTFACIHQI